MLRFSGGPQCGELVAVSSFYMVSFRVEKIAAIQTRPELGRRGARAEPDEAAMTTFDEREKAYEAQLAHDEELKFRAYVRRNKMLGLWAAEKLGKNRAAATDYAAALIKTHIEGTGDESVFAKLRADFDAAQVTVSDHQIRREMVELFAMATKEIVSGASQPH
jgi:hypothetical protein